MWMKGMIVKRKRKRFVVSQIEKLCSSLDVYYVVSVSLDLFLTGCERDDKFCSSVD